MFPFDLNPRPRRGFALAGLATALAFMASGSFAQNVPCGIGDLLTDGDSEAAYDFTLPGAPQDVFDLSGDGINGHLDVTSFANGASNWAYRMSSPTNEGNESDLPAPITCADNSGDPRGLGSNVTITVGGESFLVTHIVLLEDTGTNQAQVTDELSVTNLTGGVLVLDFYHRLKPLVSDDPADVPTYAGNTQGIPGQKVFTFTDGADSVQYGCPDCEFARLRTADGSTQENEIFIENIAGAPNNYAGAVPAGPGAPGAYAAGFQWVSDNFLLGAGETHFYRVVYTVNDTVDFGTPLAVELESFNATTRGKRSPVSIAWTTSAEIDNLGFYVYRAERDNARSAWKMAEEPVNLTLIPSRGTPSRGADYRLMDVASRSGEVAYFLVDIDISGRETVHGPALLTIVNPGNTQAEVAGGPDAEAGNDSRLPNALNNGRATR